MKTIPLSGGYTAIVDDDDYERVCRYKWYPQYLNGEVRYAKHASVKNCYHTQFSLHRFIMGCKKGDGKVVDHINGNGLDNRKCNLRICTQAKNRLNARGKVKSTSRYKGVSWNTRQRKWYATTRYNGKYRLIGTFDDEEEAAIAYNVAVQLFYGEYAYLNDV